jgi:capsular exopolysaccharide synthesis family protein
LTRPASAPRSTPRVATVATVPMAPVNALPAAKPTKQSIPLAVLRGTLRRWRLAVTLGMLVAAAAGTAVWLFLPPAVPTASAKLHMPLKPMGAIGEHPDPPLERATQVELIKSQLVLNAALRDGTEASKLPLVKAEADILEWLRKKLTVEFLGPEILRIALSYQDGEQARVMVDAIKDSYLTNVANKSSTTRAARLELLKSIAANQQKTLSRQRETVRELAKDSGVFDTERRVFIQETLRSQMQQARTQLLKAEADLKAGKIKEQMYAADAPVEITKPVLDGYVEADAGVRLAVAELKKADAELEQKNKMARSPQQKEVKDAEKRVADLTKDLADLRAKVGKEMKFDREKESKTERATKLQAVKAENTLLDQQVTQLKGELDAYAKTLSDNRVAGNEIAPIQFEIKQNEEMLASILKQITFLSIEQDAPPRVEQMEPATIARVDENRRKMMMAAGAAVGGFVAVLVLVGLVEVLLRRVESTDAITQGLGLRVVGTVPRPKAPITGRQVSADGTDHHGLAEAIACTRTMILHGEGLSEHRTVLITSPVSGEGKTTLSVQLAVSIAATGQRTLLIDADMRNPNTHVRLGLPAARGLCEALRGEAAVSDLIQETSVAGLYVLPAGFWSADIPQILTPDRLSQVFTACQGQFDFILVDSSPVLPVADALLIARHVDGIILSLLQGVSRLNQTTEAIQRFASLGVPILGAIVNGTKPQTYGRSKYYYAPAPVAAAATSTEPT